MKERRMATLIKQHYRSTRYIHCRLLVTPNEGWGAHFEMMALSSKAPSGSSFTSTPVQNVAQRQPEVADVCGSEAYCDRQK